MSRRRNTVTKVGTHQRETRTCECGHPTRDGAYVCDDCLDGLSADLREMLPTSDDDGLWESLQSVIAGERGIDYRALGDTGPGSGEPGVVATGLVLDEAAVRRARRLRALLRSLVVACQANRVSHTAAAEWTPRSRAEVPAMAEWLSWRVAGMAWHPEFASSPGQVQKAVEAARRTVMPPPHRQWLGECSTIGCGGVVKARRDDTFAECDDCGATYEATARRDWLIAQLVDRQCTAAEIAELWDPDPSVRPAVRKRLNLWAHRGHLLGWPRVCDWRPGVCAIGLAQRGRNAPTADAPSTFRFGDAFDLLLDHERRRVS